MNAKTVREELGGEREQLVETLEKAAAISLSRAHVIRTEKLETIQAFVMYLVRRHRFAGLQRDLQQIPAKASEGAAMR